jgi:uncharacterized OsmC-like protein
MDESPTVRLTRVDDYAFDVDFDIDVPTLRSDEPEPLGKGDGPNPTRMLLAAVGHCLSASLLFCLSKAHIEVGDVKTTATARLERNEKGRWRVSSMAVRIEHGADAETTQKMKRCLELFEDFCVVTGSVRHGIPVEVTVVRSP